MPRQTRGLAGALVCRHAVAGSDRTTPDGECGSNAVIPNDLPYVSIVGTPRRLPRDVAPGGHWEWLAVELEPDGITVPVFDPDHVCPPGALGHRARIGLELFQPQVTPNEGAQPAIAAEPMARNSDLTPIVHGAVIAYHHHRWNYSGPVLSHDSPRAAAVTHVLDAPHVTLRLVIATREGTLLAQLKDGRDAPEIGDTVTLRGGRFELLTILPCD